MILFALEGFKSISATLEKAAHSASGRFQVARFENGELHVDVRTSVTNERCLIVGSIAPPDEQLLSTLLLSHTLKKDGARSVTAILPYLAYARHDKVKPGESLATGWAGALARASGIDDVITVDVHSQRASQLFPIPVCSLSPADVFADAMKRYGLGEATIVAPDEGALGRCRAVKTAAGAGDGDIPYFEKQRTATGITHIGPIGKVGRQAVIIDDILDTGGTLLSACETLAVSGVQEINVMVTHGLFTGSQWKKLWQFGVKRIFYTDTIPLAPSVNGQNLVRLSVASLLEREVRRRANA